MDPKHLLETFGTFGLFAVIFAETGLLIGFFLPGDSLLVLAGLFCGLGHRAPVHLHLAEILLGLFVAAVAGAQTGYLIGLRAGPALFRRPDSRLFKRENVDRAQSYFDEHGPFTVVLARFIPVVRTFANPMAGVGRMKARTFTTFNLIGGLGWTVGLTLVGYLLGKKLPGAQDHVLLIELVIIALSLIPIAVEFRRSRRERPRPAAAVTSSPTPPGPA